MSFEHIDVIFVTPEDVPWYGKLAGNIVKAWTDSPYSHACLGFHTEEGYKIFEAHLEGVEWMPGDLYDGVSAKKVIPLPVEKECYDRMIAHANGMQGKKYGLDDCIIGGIHDKMAKFCSGELTDKVDEFLLENFDKQHTRDCSAVVLEILRIRWPHLMAGRGVATVTPEALEESMFDLINEVTNGRQE